MSEELARESVSLVSARAHVLQVNEILTQLGVDPNCGLSTDENQIRIDRDGMNVIPARKSITIWERIWAQINSFLIFILVAGAAISFAFHHMLDGYVIVGVVVINVSLGYFMEGQAANATDALKKMMNPSALVLRDGEKLERDSTSLSQGDIFFLQPGDIIPADGRVLKAAGLFVLEAALTGESRAILKDILPSSSQLASLADRKCMVYSGTQVLQGTATVVTTATGPRCEIGKISGLLAEIEPEKTPLLLQLDKFGMILSVVIIILACATFGIALARGHPIDEALAIAIGVSVAAIPEGLPSCITVTFSIGVSYMAKQHAIVKSLPAVETLGSVSVICSDKTGTLTINKMTVKSICTTSEFFEVSWLICIYH
jgi:P-type E1-E2 ATPase